MMVWAPGGALIPKRTGFTRTGLVLLLTHREQ